MPTYFYTAKALDGQTHTGSAQAQDERQLAQTLKSDGLILIRAASGQEKKSFFSGFNLFFTRVSPTEKIMLTRNLWVMFSAGLSLVKSFDILSSQTKNKKLKVALQDIRDRISKGENFSEALAQYPHIFSELFCNMIKVGEEAGTLDEVFQILSLQLSKERELKSKIKNAMIYPAIIVMVMMVVGAVIVTVVLPSLNVFFTALQVDIPLYTRILLFAGNFLSVNWYLLFLVPLLAAASLFLALKTQQGKRAFDTLLMRLPLISPIVKKNNSAFLIRSVSSLIVAGVSLIRALEISSKTVHNHYFQEAMVDAGEKIKKGDKLSSALKVHQEIFPLGVIEMIEVGEETGKTSVILKKLADFYEQEAVSAIEKLTVIIEPLLIIVLGLAVGFFAFSIIQPMYSSLKSINQ